MLTPLSDRQRKQFIDADQCWLSLRAAEIQSVKFQGSMYWRRVKGHDYLIKEYSKLRQQSLGVRSSETEKIITEFKKGKAEADERLRALKQAMEMHRLVNKAYRVGRVPEVVINILEAIRKAGLQDHFLVIGTNALYAYETHAGVRFDGDITATTDVDFLWDSRKKIVLAADDETEKNGFMGLLLKADSSFRLLDDNPSRAANNQGYLVDLVKRRTLSLFDEKEPQQIFPNENDFWAAKIYDMNWMLSSPKFRETIVGENGKMAEMVTVDPRAFVLQKAWTSQKSDRDPIKKPRDISQAKAVFQLIQEHLPHLSFENIHVFPEKIRSAFIEFKSNDVDGRSEVLKL